MASGYTLGAYWPARREPIEACASRLGKLLVGLGNADPVLSKWYETGETREDALKRRAQPDDSGYLLDLLHRGRSRRDVGGEVIEDLGLSAHVWNAANKGRAASLSVRCGLYSERLSNCVVLTLPEDLGELAAADHMAGALAVVATAWEPAWAGVISDKAMAKRRLHGHRPFVDWMIYVPFRIRQVPAPSSVLELPGPGSIAIVQPHPPSADNPGDLDRIARVQALVDEIAPA
jgi:hypothetical protein